YHARARRPRDAATRAFQGRAVEGVFELRLDPVCVIDARHARVAFSTAPSIARDRIGPFSNGRVRVFHFDRRILSTPQPADEHWDRGLSPGLLTGEGSCQYVDLLLLPDDGTRSVSLAGLCRCDRRCLDRGPQASGLAPGPLDTEAKRSLPVR